MIKSTIDNKLTESSRAPFDEVKARFRLNRSDGKRAFTRYNIATIQQSNSHIFSFSGVTHNHLVVGLEALKGQLGYFEGFVRAFGCRDDRCIANQRVMDT